MYTIQYIVETEIECGYRQTVSIFIPHTTKMFPSKGVLEYAAYIQNV